MELACIYEKQIFEKDFKIYGTKEEPLFLAKDIAILIDYEISNVSKMVKNVDEDEKIIARTNSTSAIFLTEDGLYEVLMQSRKPIAKKFKKEVKKILKEIRLTGGYLGNNDNLTDEQIMARAYVIAQNTIKRREEQINELKFQNKIKDQQIMELTPKVAYYDLILQCSDLLSVTMISKDYGYSAIKFNEMLHEFGIQYKQGDVWFLYQKYASEGYTHTKTHKYTKKDGNAGVKIHTHWTQKGRLFLYDFLKSKGILPLIEQGVA